METTLDENKRDKMFAYTYIKLIKHIFITNIVVFEAHCRII